MPGRRKTQSISEAVQKLRDRSLITCGRGSITVLDRAGLLARACECYVIVQAHMERLLSISTKGFKIRRG